MTQPIWALALAPVETYNQHRLAGETQGATRNTVRIGVDWTADTAPDTRTGGLASAAATAPAAARPRLR